MRRATKRFDVLGLGAVAVDDVLYVRGYPPADAKARVLRQERHCGGLTATALVAAARLGARCAYAGVLGQDELSEFVLGCLAREGIDVSKVQRRRPFGPVHSHIVVDQSRGTRNIFFDENGVQGAPSTPHRSLVASSRVLFVDNVGVPGMVRAARFARRSGVPVVADLESNIHPQFPALLALADHLILSRDFAQILTGARTAAAAVLGLDNGERQVWAVSDGAAGCWYQARGWSTPRHQPAFRVTAVDTTGCGDVFHGAYAFALAQGFPVEERFRIAAAAAALKAIKPGGQAGCPTWSAVRRFLKMNAADVELTVEE
jgi:sugar/nucleoside kinase (ribokinase family)